MRVVHIDREKIAGFCRKHHIRKLALFGSVLRDDFGPESDVDVLVEFEPSKTIGLFGLYGLKVEFSRLLGGRRVDLNTSDPISRYFRDKVFQQAQVIYGGG